MKGQPYSFSQASREHTLEIESNHHTYQIEMGGSIDGFNSVYYVETYSGHMRQEVRFEPNEYLIIENTGHIDVVNPQVVVNERRNWHSADTILAEILKPSMTDREKAMAVFRFCSSFDIQAHENDLRVGPPFPDDASNPSRNTFKERADPVKAANCYYCGGCQYSASNFVILCRYAGLEARAVWISQRDRYATHCVAEVKYDGQYHLFDPENRTFYLTSDNTDIASYQQISQDLGLLERTHHSGFANLEKPWCQRKYKYDLHCPPHEMPVEQWLSRLDVTLRPDERLIRRWDNIGKFRHGHNVRHKPGIPYRLADGKLIYQPNLADENHRRGIVSELNIVASWEDGLSPHLHPHVVGDRAYVIYKVQSPYPIVGGLAGGTFRRKEGDLRICLSVGQSDWIEIWSAEITGVFEWYVSLDEWIDPLHTEARYDYYIKYEFTAAASPDDVGIDQVYIESDLEMANTSLPSLSVGENRVIYQDDTAGSHSVRVTHGWEENSEAQSPDAPAGTFFPQDGMTVPVSLLEKLQWQAATCPDGDEIADYHIQVSPRPDMLLPVSPNFDRIISSSEPEWAIPHGWLVPGRRYFWRVRAQSKWGLWSEWSEVWQFIA
jgi:hypothetical protein